MQTIRIKLYTWCNPVIHSSAGLLDDAWWSQDFLKVISDHGMLSETIAKIVPAMCQTSCSFRTIIQSLLTIQISAFAPRHQTHTSLVFRLFFWMGVHPAVWQRCSATIKNPFSYSMSPHPAERRKTPACLAHNARLFCAPKNMKKRRSPPPACIEYGQRFKGDKKSLSALCMHNLRQIQRE